jgi:hypothetical protein
MEGWFAMDRVMDAPVDQDILTGESRPDRWERLLLSRSFWSGIVHLLWMSAMREGCGLLADGQIRHFN